MTEEEIDAESSETTRDTECARNPRFPGGLPAASPRLR